MKSLKFKLLSIFFLSGFSSLIYQVVWQKALSQIIGVDHVSVTLIISLFMLGLGLG
jgi:predicted membrane-bound spermidine synthase